jgi:hypothetical protein
VLERYGPLTPEAIALVEDLGCSWCQQTVRRYWPALRWTITCVGNHALGCPARAKDAQLVGDPDVLGQRGTSPAVEGTEPPA